MKYKPLINTKNLGQKARQRRADRVALACLIVLNIGLAIAIYKGLVLRGII